jgi:hypothetical protein
MQDTDQSAEILGSAYDMYRAKKITKGAFESELKDYLDNNGSLSDSIVRIEDEDGTDSSKSFVAAVLPELKNGTYETFILLGAHCLDNDWICDRNNCGVVLKNLLDGLNEAAQKAILVLSFFDRQVEHNEFTLSDILIAYLKVYYAAISCYPPSVIDAITDKHILDIDAVKKALSDATDTDDAAELLKRLDDDRVMPKVFFTVINEQYSSEIAAKTKTMKAKMAKITGLTDLPKDNELGNTIISNTNSDIGDGFGGPAGEKGGPSIKF